MKLLQQDRAELLADARAELYRRDLVTFVKRAWAEIDPAPLVWTWHMEAICLHLQAVTEGRIKRLLITVPPGHAKSLLVSVLWPAWSWLFAPAWSLITASYAEDLALRDARRCRLLIESRWYQDTLARLVRFGRAYPWQFAKDSNQIGYYSNTVFGARKAIGVKGQGTGFRSDAQVIDDPLSAQDAHSEAERKRVLVWWDEVMPSRLNDLERGQVVIIAQRLHHADLPGHVLEKAGNAYTHLCLPTEYEPKPSCKCHTCVAGETPIGWRDPRKVAGELLFPAKFGEKVIAQAKIDLGGTAFAAQHQQQPTSQSGGIFQRSWFRRVWRKASEPDRPMAPEPWERDIAWDVCEIDPAGPWDGTCIACDAAFKKTTDSDLVAVGAFGKRGADIYLLDIIWERMDIVGTIAALKEMSRRFPKIVTKIIEDKANGPAIITLLKGKMPGIVAVKPLGSKEARVQAAAPYIEAGNVWLPLHHEKRRALVMEACSFPRGAHDDGIDMLAYGIIRLGQRVSRMAGLVSYE